MTDDRFASILADCLQSVDEGRATPAECAARYPEYADLIESHFAVVGRLRAAVPVVPAGAQTLGGERLQQAVVQRNNAAIRPAPRSVLGLVRNGVAVAVGALILAGGAAGASAAVGGPNIAGEVISAIAQIPGQVRNAIGRDSTTETPSATATATSQGGASPDRGAPTPDGPSTPPASAERGLCQAYVSGGGRNGVVDGQSGNRLDAQAFQRLNNAAGAQGVDAFCAALLEQDRKGPAGAPGLAETPTGGANGNPNGNGDPNGNPNGNPKANPNGNPNTNPNGNGDANGNPNVNPTAAPKGNANGQGQGSKP